MVGLVVGSRGDELAEGGQAAVVDAPQSATGDADAALARRCRNGDVAAFRELVERHEKRVYALVARVLGPTTSQDDIDDTVQDIFVQAWRALPRFRGDAKLSTWLYRVATNMAIKQWHRIRRQRHVVSNEDLPESVRIGLSDPEPGPAAAAESGDRDRAVKAAIELLPEKQRTVILLHYFEGHPCEEVAQIMGCSVGTVWSRLHYACRKLRGSLDWLQQTAS
jgi:RNA polymerase sigma-70 factor, ECF subfamily